MTVTTRVDLRGVPVFQRPDAVVDALGHLPQGTLLTVVTENEPRGLAAGIRERRNSGVAIQTRRVADREWHLLVTSSTLAAGHTLDVALRHVPMFSRLDDAARAQLARGATTHVARRGHTVAPENVEWPWLGVVLDGVLALSTGETAQRRRVFYELHQYEVFGETEFFDSAMTLGRTIVLSKNARYARIPYSEVREVCKQNPDLIFALGEVCAQHKRELIDALSDHAAMPIIARISQVLLRYSTPGQGLCPAVAPLPSMTQSLIAASAGTVKEVAARAIADLESRGALKRERGHIVALDRQVLLDLIKAHE